MVLPLTAIVSPSTMSISCDAIGSGLCHSDHGEQRRGEPPKAYAHYAATSSMSVGSSSSLPVLLTRFDTGHVRKRSSAVGLRSLAPPAPSSQRLEIRLAEQHRHAVVNSSCERIGIHCDNRTWPQLSTPVRLGPEPNRKSGAGTLQPPSEHPFRRVPRRPVRPPDRGRLHLARSHAAQCASE